MVDRAVPGMGIDEERFTHADGQVGQNHVIGKMDSGRRIAIPCGINNHDLHLLNFRVDIDGQIRGSNPHGRLTVDRRDRVQRRRNFIKSTIGRGERARRVLMDANKSGEYRDTAIYLLVRRATKPKPVRFLDGRPKLSRDVAYTKMMAVSAEKVGRSRPLSGHGRFDGE